MAFIKLGKSIGNNFIIIIFHLLVSIFNASINK